MTLTFDLSSTRDLFAKLQRDADALDEEVTSDRLFNFVVTGYSMIDWVKNDPALPASTKKESAIKGLYNDKWLNICGDLATACKHFNIKKRQNKTTSGQLKTSSAPSLKGFGVGRFGKGVFGVGEESIEIQLNDGRTFNCLDLVQGVVTAWQTFFSAHGI